MQYLVVSPLGESFESSSRIDDLSKEIERKLGYKVSQQHLTIESENISQIRRRRGQDHSIGRIGSTSTPMVEEEPPVKILVNPSWYPSFLDAYMALMRSVFDLILIKSERRFDLVKKWHLKLGTCHPLLKTFVSNAVVPFISNMLLVIFGACLMGVCAQISISLPSSISAVPITGQTFGVLWLGSLTGFVIAPLSILLYLFCGSVLDIPWFSNQTHGNLVLFQSSSSGFLIGFVFSALVCGWFCSKMASDRTIMMNLLMLCLSNAVTFVFGCGWLAFGVPNLGLSKGIEKGLETIKISLVLVMIRLSWFVLFQIRKVVLKHLIDHDNANSNISSSVNVEEGQLQIQTSTPMTTINEDGDDNRCLSTCSNISNQ